MPLDIGVTCETSAAVVAFCWWWCWSVPSDGIRGRVMCDRALPLSSSDAAALVSKWLLLLLLPLCVPPPPLSATVVVMCTTPKPSAVCWWCAAVEGP